MELTPTREIISINYQSIRSPNQNSPKSRITFNYPQNSNFPNCSTTAKISYITNAFYFFEFFLCVSYYALLVPFRMKSTGGIYRVHSNLLQKILSTTTVMLICGNGILDLRYYISGNLMKNPHKAFAYSYALIVNLGYGPLWIWTFFCGGKAKFEDFLSSSQLLLRGVERPKGKWLYIGNSIVLYCILKLVLEQGWSDLWVKGFRGTLQYYGGIVLYNLHIRSDDSPLSEEDLASPSLFTFAFFSTVVFNLSRAIEHFIEAFTVIAALSCYHGVTKFRKILGGWEGGVDPRFAKTYGKWRDEVGWINAVASGLVFIYMAGMVPTFVWCVFGVFENSEFQHVLYYLHKFVMHLGMLGIAAEAAAKGMELGGWILKRFAEREMRKVEGGGGGAAAGKEEEDKVVAEGFLHLVHAEVHRNPVGLQGLSFFTISYGLIGTIISVFVTYAVVMFEFQVDKEARAEQIECNCSSSSNDTFILGDEF